MYKPQGKTLHDFHQAQTHVKGVIGPLGSGKTFGAINELLMSIHNQVPDRNGLRDSRWVIARNTYPDLISSTIPDFRSVTDDIPHGEFKMGQVITWHTEYARADGTKVRGHVEFKSFDGDQDVKKARGMQLTGVWVDELAEFNKSNWDMLTGRVGRYPPRDHNPNAIFKCLFTSNACPRDHWLAQLALVNTPSNWWIGVQPGGLSKSGNAWKLNPKAENTNNLPPGYYLNQVGGKKESWIRQNLCNEFVHHSDGRPIHPDFNEQLHVGDLVPIPALPIHIGMDWGRTPAAVIAQQQPNGQWYVLREIVLTNAGSDKLGAAVRRVLNAEYSGMMVQEATGDPSGSSMAQTKDETPLLIFDEYSGLQSQPAYTNDFDLRVAALDALLTKIIEGQPAIMVDRSCQSLIAGLSGAYQFRRVQIAGADKYHDKPDKGPTSHVVESLHYLLMGAGESDNLFIQSWEATMDDLPDYNYATFE
jgi:hypothetical protein